MKYFLCFLLNLAISVAIFFTSYSSQKDYVMAISTTQCFPEQANNVFCAQCVNRNHQVKLSPQKGFTVFSEHPYALLKLQHIAQSKTCSQYLSIINYKKSDKGLRVPYQLADDFKQQFKDKLQNNMLGTSIVGPQSLQFVIYRLFPLDLQKKSIVKHPDPSQIEAILHSLSYLITSIIAIFLVLYFINKSIFNHLKTKILIPIVFHFAILQASTLNLIPHEFGLKASRILILCIFLSCVQINNKAISFGLILYALCTSSPLFYLIYLNLMFGLIFTKGMNEQRFKNVWSYIILNLMTYTLNQFFWYFLQQEIADTACQFIEMMFLILAPTGIMLLKDEKQFKLERYKHYQRQTISLSGFEEGQQDQEQTM